jgi:hypothetical protein
MTMTFMKSFSNQDLDYVVNLHQSSALYWLIIERDQYVSRSDSFGICCKTPWMNRPDMVHILSFEDNTLVRLYEPYNKNALL